MLCVPNTKSNWIKLFQYYFRKTENLLMRLCAAVESYMVVMSMHRNTVIIVHSDGGKRLQDASGIMNGIIRFPSMVYGRNVAKIEGYGALRRLRTQRKNAVPTACIIKSNSRHH